MSDDNKEENLNTDQDIKNTGELDQENKDVQDEETRENNINENPDSQQPDNQINGTHIASDRKDNLEGNGNITQKKIQFKLEDGDQANKDIIKVSQKYENGQIKDKIDPVGNNDTNDDLDNENQDNAKAKSFYFDAGKVEPDQKENLLDSGKNGEKSGDQKKGDKNGGNQKYKENQGENPDTDEFGLTNENNIKDPQNAENLGKNTNNIQNLETEPIEEEIESVGKHNETSKNLSNGLIQQVPETPDELELKRKQQEELEEKLTKANDNLDISNNKLEVVNKSIDARQILLAELRDMGKNAPEQSMDRLYFRMSQLEEEVILRDNQIQTHVRKVQTLENMLRKFKEFGTELAELRSLVKEKDQSLEALELEMEDFAGKIKQERKLIDEEHQKLQYDYKKLQEEMDGNKRELGLVQAKNTELEEQNSDLRNKLDQTIESFKRKMTLELDQKTTELDQKSHMNTDYLKQISLLEAALESQVSRNNQLTLENENNAGEQAKVMEAIKKRDEKIENLEKDYTEKIKSEREEKERVYGDLKIERDENRILKNKIIDLEKQVLNKEVEIYDKELEDSTKKVITDDVANQMKKEIEGKIKAVENIMTKNDDTTAELKKLKEKQDETEYKNRYLNEIVNELNNKCERIIAKAKEQKETIEKLKIDNKEAIYQKRKQEIMNKDKAECLKKAIDSIEIYKKTLNRIKKENSEQVKTNAGKVKEISKLNDELKALKEETQSQIESYKKMLKEYSNFKGQLSEKDSWILKLGKEVSEQKGAIQNNKKRHIDYKSFVEMDYERNQDQKDTEIMVLKEMVKSAKSMVRAREMDIQRFKNKLRSHENNMANSINVDEGGASSNHYRIQSGKRNFDDKILNNLRGNKDYVYSVDTAENSKKYPTTGLMNIHRNKKQRENPNLISTNDMKDYTGSDYKIKNSSSMGYTINKKHKIKNDQQMSGYSSLSNRPKQIVDKDVSDVKEYIKTLEMQSHNSTYKNMDEIRGMLDGSQPDKISNKKNNFFIGKNSNRGSESLTDRLIDNNTDILKKKLDSIKESDGKNYENSHTKEVDISNSNIDQVQITQNSDHEDNHLENTKNRRGISKNKEIEEGDSGDENQDQNEDEEVEDNQTENEGSEANEEQLSKLAELQTRQTVQKLYKIIY